MTSKVIMGAAAALSVFALSGAANAASVTFNSFVSNDSNPLGATVTITESGMNMFDVSLDLADGDTGRLTGFYLGTSLDEPNDVRCSQLSFNASFDAPSCNDSGAPANNNSNLNGLIDNYAVFDFSLAYPQQGNANYIDETDLPVVLFTITSDMLTLADFENVGLRFQASNAPGGSEKLYDDNPMSPVPLPAAGFLLLAGLGGLAAARRRAN